MTQAAVALFGEAEKGSFDKALLCLSQEELFATLGSSNNQAVSLASKALSFHYSVLFFRVKEEGFSRETYLSGIQQLKILAQSFDIVAVGLPGVSDTLILEATSSLCKKSHSFLLFSDKDLYDLMTS